MMVRPGFSGPMGRETAIQPIELTDNGWFRLPFDDRLPRVDLAAPNLATSAVEPEIENDDFDSDRLNSVCQWLRSPWPEEFFSLTERPGHLRLFGMESPGSLCKQALIARRQKHTLFEAETLIEFAPRNFQQMAGLILYYNSSKFHYLYVSTDGNLGKHIDIMSCEADFSLRATFPIRESRIPIPEDMPVGLRMQVDNENLHYSWSLGARGNQEWNSIPVTLDVRLLTDQSGKDEGEQFTGTFVGICAHDVSGRRARADFDYFSYRPRP